MDTEREKRAYLKEMGIQPWVLREKALPVVETNLPAQTGATTVENAGDDAQIALLDWNQLQKSVLACQRCDLHKTRTKTVFGSGNPNAELLIIGEAPGAEEDKQGLPFVGRAGQLLTEMLIAIGLTREQVFIANTLKCRPPNNRNPLPNERQQCEPYLQRQVELIRPKILLALGRVAAHNILKTEESLGRLRGREHAFLNTNVIVYVTYHPAYLLRQPSEKRKAWQDLKLVRSVL